MTDSGGGPERDDRATQQVPIPGRQPADDPTEQARQDAPPPVAATAPQQVPPEPPAPPRGAQQFYEAPLQPQSAPPRHPPTQTFATPPQTAQPGPPPPYQPPPAQYGPPPTQQEQPPAQYEAAPAQGAAAAHYDATAQVPYGAQQGAAGPVLAPAENWHRLHYPIGVFLIAYGLTALLASLLGWNAHRKEIAGYLGEGIASPALIAIKVAEVLIVAVTIAGVLRRRDVWFLPALFGWMAGFGIFCVLDLAKGKPGRLIEHAAYLVLFAVLLFLSYAFGVKARVGREAPVPSARKGSQPKNLSRTQEIALAALNRWQREQPQQGTPPH